MAKKLHIILPMAGRGSRFANAGFTTPKPLIKVDGIPMFLKALSSLDSIKADVLYTIIIRKEHDEKYDLKELLIKSLPSANIVISDEEPRGAVVDALKAKPYIEATDLVTVMDCDLWFQSSSYNKMVEDVLEGISNIAGGVLTFQADNPRYSYAKFGADNIVTETAEKKVISDHAMTGAYFFASAKEFIHSADILLQRPTNPEMPEYFISFLYNILIDEGKKIQAAIVDKFASFGTPEELAAYESSHRSA
jgi:dTDP-glucose pyrophosphorylase